MHLHRCCVAVGGHHGSAAVQTIMSDTSLQLRLTFKAKVLIPLITLMVLLVVVVLCVVNYRMTRQLRTEAAQRLSTADAVFANSEKIRARNLLMRYNNIPNEPRFKAVCQLAEPKTMRFLLNELVNEIGADVIAYTTEKGDSLASARRTPQLDLTEFELAAAVSARQALEGQPNVDTVSVATKLFDVVSIPVKISGRVVGVLTFGVEIGDVVAQEFQQLTHSQIVLLAHERVAASTLQNREGCEQLAEMLGKASATVLAPRQVVLGDEHFLSVAGCFPSLSGDNQLGYVLLSSYEQSLGALRTTQRTLLVLGLLAIGLSTSLVWRLIDHVTRPLRQLREGAERVGRGDFSQHVQVNTRDECGELAAAFNRMTSNLQMSRGELEKTVEDLKKTQAQLTQTEKLSVIGEFVAGVAHELNNPLASVYGFAQLLHRPDAAKDAKHDHYLDRILRESQRCYKIVQNLLSFARQSPPERQRLNFNELVHSSLEILQYQLRTSNIEIITTLDEQLPTVIGDPHQLQQVFVNIINNARQAIESYRSSGIVRITTSVRAGRVRISFQDNGPGVSPPNLKKIFTPFFTTKEVGKGTGLGLSLCYGIVNEHGGTMSVSSTFGEGATFVVELPVAEARAPSTSEILTESATVTLSSSTSGRRVLVVDDEEALRDLISETLAADRYVVDTAGDGETALRMTQKARYDLVVCDWKMPGMNGLEFYQQLKTTDPETASHFIFLTGDVVGAQKSLGTQVDHWLPKPFSLDDLRATVNKVAAAEVPPAAPERDELVLGQPA